MFQSLASSSSGGKAALLGGVSGDPECGNERDPVWVSAAVDLDVGHHQPDGVVATQHGPQFLVDKVGCLRPQHTPGLSPVFLSGTWSFLRIARWPTQRVGPQPLTSTTSWDANFLQPREHPAAGAERFGGTGLDRHLNEIASRVVDAENIDFSESDKQLAHARSIGFHRGSPQSVWLKTFRLAGPLYRVRGPSRRPAPAYFRCAALFAALEAVMREVRDHLQKLARDEVWIVGIVEHFDENSVAIALQNLVLVTDMNLEATLFAVKGGSEDLALRRTRRVPLLHGSCDPS